MIVDSNNVVVNNNYLRLKLTGTNPSLLRLGQVESLNSDYSFGYFEISARLVYPGYYNSSSQPILSGIRPTFWLYYVQAGSTCYHDEIDMLDNCYGDYKDGIDPSEDTKLIDGGHC